MVIKMKKAYWMHIADGVKEITTKEGKLTVGYNEGSYWVNDGTLYLAKGVRIVGDRVRVYLNEGWKEYYL